MLIEKKLPYDFCDNCDEFILKVDDQLTFLQPVGCTERVITVYCKNAGKCVQLKRNIEKQMKEGVDDGRH